MMQNLRDRSLAYILVLSLVTLTILLGYSWSQLVSPASAATTFFVFNTNDGGAGSLRQAIINANGSPGVDTIKFNLPSGGVNTLIPGSPLPTITDPVIIDGYSQIGTSPNTLVDGNNAALLIEIDGTNLVVDPCLTITGGGSTVQGLVINRCRFGIMLNGAGGNTIQGNFFGTDPTGTIRRANFVSVDVLDSPNNTIGGTTPAARNLISGNSPGQGILIQSPLSTGNVVAGNFIGTNAAGSAALNNSQGVLISDAPGNTIGGTAAGARNVISGNTTGISISLAGSTGNVVAGNFIGTNAGGTAVVANTTGVSISAPSNTIGGTTLEARNIISGNILGISLTTGATTNLVQGNYIGLNASGAAALLNARGVWIQNGATNNLIGGTTTGARNIISGNAAGVFVLTNATGVNNRVEGNFIGTDPAGTAGIPNQIGVDIALGTANITGGTANGAGNVIAYNGLAVLVESSASGNPILGNSIFSNHDGIDLADDLVTINDVGDGDTGANNLQNYPVVTFATSSGGNTNIGGTLNSTPNISFRIEFFANTVLDDSGFGQGQTFLGSTTVTTDGSGNTSFAFSTGTAIASGQFITTTATSNASNDTSEFSQGVEVNGAETFQFPQPHFRVSENGSVATITVIRTNGGGGTSSVDYFAVPAIAFDATGPGIAFDGIDFTSTSGTLTFGVGETSKTFTVSIIDDAQIEGDEFFAVFLTNPSLGTVLGPLNHAEVFINDREQTIYGVTNTNNLISFERANPATVYSRVPITGLQPGEQILGIDFRPSNALLYGLGSLSRLYTIDIDTAVATEVGSGPFSPLLSGSDFGFDFNPVVDRIRVVSNTDQNFRLNPDTGMVVASDTTLAYEGSDPNASANPNVVGLAYTNNTAGATSTTLYGIDSTIDTLVRVGSPGGTPTSPNSGQLFTIGALGFTTAANTSFDILPSGDTALAALTPQGAPFSILHTIDLTTGLATQVNNPFNIPFIGGQALIQPLRAMAVKTSGSIGFASSTATVVEGAGKVQIILSRTGDLSGAASADFATSDGTAAQTSDYSIGFGTLLFAPGEASKTFEVIITDDGYTELPETFNISLSNPQGGFQIGGITNASVTITDNDAVPAVVNPIEGADFFVRQHYVDFLNREPDTAGFDFWTNEITSCGSDTQCLDVKRVNVSAAFFLSIEFQRTGSLVFLTHKATVGTNYPGSASVPVLYQQFQHDTATIQHGLVFGQPNFDLKLEVNKQIFFADFVAQPEFEVTFPAALTPAEFVDGLIANTGVAFSTDERTILISFFFGAPTSADQQARARVLRRVAENPTFAAAEFNRTFVTMEYFGYLRRDPDALGFNFWLNKLNSFNGNFVAADMVKSFITSSEYRQRFGAN